MDFKKYEEYFKYNTNEETQLDYNRSMFEKETAPQKKHIPYVFYATAFFVPVVIMLIVYVCIGIYPFGDKTLLTIDLYHQYIDFFSYYRQTLASMSFGNFFYSFSKTLGGNMIGLYAYYLASPINLLFLFFKSENLSEGIMLITLVKIGLCGLSFSYMYRKLFNTKSWYTLIFSTCYALMAYNIVFQQNIMWLDGVMWLPIVVIGINNIVQKKNFIVYAISLSVAMLSNYYIGYMICIFSLIFFVYIMVTENKNPIEKKEIFTKIGLFVLGSAFAVGASAFLLIPTFVSLQGGKATFDPSRFNLGANFEFSQLLQKLFIGEIDIDLLHQGLKTTLPDIFCGTTTTLLTLLYFFNKKISFKEKISSLLMLFILTISFHIKAFDLIWHGMSTPVGFLYRNSFLFSFFCIYLGAKTFNNLDGITKENLLTVIAVFIAIGIFVGNFSLETLTSFEIYLTVLFFILYVLTIKVIMSGKKGAYLVLAFMLILTVEFEINGCLTLENASYVSKETYSTAVSSLGKTINRVSAIDNGIYRIDKTYMRSRNDGMMHGYKTLTHSSSTADFGVVEFLNKMGFRNESNIGNSYDYGSTLPATSLLGIKYILSDTNETINYFDDGGYSDNIRIFKNPYALPLMFKGNSKVLETGDNSDIFKIQNDLYSSLSGNGNVLTEITGIKVNQSNITKTINENNNNFTKVNEDAEAYIEFEFNAINNEEIYAYFPTEPISDSTVDVYVNGDKKRQHLDSDHLTYYDVLNLGKFKKGTPVKLRFVLQDNETNFEGYYFYALDMDNFKKATDRLKTQSVNIDIKSQRHILAKVDGVESAQLVFTTIPYDKGWDIRVDGNKVKAEKVLDTLTAIPVTSGDHTIEMKYTPPGLKIGVVVSAVTVCIFGVYIAMIIMQKKKESQI